MVLINDPGIYLLIMSKYQMPLPKKFQDWVYEDVLLLIHTHGECKIMKNIRKISYFDNLWIISLLEQQLEKLLRLKMIL